MKFVTNTNIPNGTQVQFTITEVNANDPTGASITLDPRSKKVTVNYDSVMVWPGDTNNDGKVDQADVLPIGLYWDRTGPVRPNASMSWTGQICPPWTPLAAAYTDATGDGKVTEADVLPIGVNWDNTHGAASPLVVSQELEKVSHPTSSTIQPEINPPELDANQEFIIRIKVSEVADLFGLAFELVYDRPQLLQVLAVEPDALLGTDVIFYSHVDASSGKLAVGISRKAGQASINGTGSVVRVKAKIAANAENGAKINFTLHHVTANDAQGAAMSFNTQASSLTVSRTTGVASQTETLLPVSFRLYQNHPNPFNAGTLIKYEIPHAGQVSMKIYNLAGQEVFELVNATQQPGRYQIHWDGQDNQGRSVPSGVYVCRIQASSFVQTQRMIVVR